MDLWTARAEGEPRRDFGVAVFDGDMYSFDANNVARSLDWVRAYDPISESWSNKTSLPTAAAYKRAEVPDDKIHVITAEETFEYTPAHDAL